MVSETTPMVLAEGQHTMALDQSALLEVLEALKAAEVDDRIRQFGLQFTGVQHSSSPSASHP
jgi:hypothetical protein